jgi:dTDP-4-amino-4,6-dideoxygalactose transaminase
MSSSTAVPRRTRATWTSGTLHLQPFYRDTCGFTPCHLPVAEDVSGRILSLPLYPAMTDDDVTDTIAAVTRLISRSRVGSAGRPLRVHRST